MDRFSSIRDNCGIALAHSLEDVNGLLRGEEHRGQEVKGIGVQTEDSINTFRWKGPLENFPQVDSKLLIGELFAGHNRYSTVGPKTDVLKDAHPHVVGGTEISVSDEHRILTGATASVVHNGTVYEFDRLARELGTAGIVLRTECDSEGIVQWYALHGLQSFMRNFPAAYSAIIQDTTLELEGGKGWAIAFRDRHGIRPAWLGKKNRRYIVASEDSPIRRIGGLPIREIQPGEAIFIKDDVYITKRLVDAEDEGWCFFEDNYFSDPESHSKGRRIGDKRFELGRQLAREYAPEVDIVTWVPNCPEPHAYGYCFERGIENRLAEIFGKRRYKERAFIQSTQQDREDSIKSNLYLLVPAESLKGKRILIVEDSIVRGTNGKVAVDLLREAGASWVGLASGTPPIGGIQNGEYRWCPFGVDMPVFDGFALVKFGGNGHTYEEQIEGIRKHMGADSLHYISHDGLYRALGVTKEQVCAYCIGGRNPVKGFKPVTLISSSAR